jgi:hypothetical protein
MALKDWKRHLDSRYGLTFTKKDKLLDVTYSKVILTSGESYLSSSHITLFEYHNDNEKKQKAKVMRFAKQYMSKH